MHSGEPDPIFPAPRRPRKGPGKLVLKGMQMFRIGGDKIVERWGRLDEVGLMRQLGLAPG